MSRYSWRVPPADPALKTPPNLAPNSLSKYDTPLVEAEYKPGAAAADAVATQALQVPFGSPILLIERTSYTSGNRSIDYERLHYCSDLIRFVTRLTRRARALMQR